MTRLSGLRFGTLAAGLLLTLACVEPNVGQAVSPLAPAPLVVEPAQATLTTGQVAAFKAKGQDGSRPAVTWEAQGGTVDANGQFTAPAAPGTCTVLAKAFGGRQASARVNVVPPPRGPVATATPVREGTRDHLASVPDQPGSTYAWTLEGGTLVGGTRGASVTFNAGLGPKLLLTCRVVNGAGLGLTASLEVPLVPGVSLSASPRTAVMTAGSNRKFGFSLEGGVTGDVVWSVLEPGGGSVDPSGRYRAPAVPGDYTVQVRSKEDPAVKDAVAVKVVAAPRGAVKGPGKVVAHASGLRASVPDQAGCTYAWKVTGGRITDGAQGPLVTFDAGDGPKLKLVCTITNEAGEVLEAALEVGVAPGA